MRSPATVKKENMMYSDKFVVAIKANGKILKETKDLVQLPFGSEFSVLVKNLNSRRAKFTLHIDGTDVLGGEEIIVNANSDVEMKRFIRNGNMDEGNAFKFIERTAAIEDGPRGIKMDDGVIRVEFWFEKQAPIVNTVTTYHNDVWWNDYYYRRGYFGSPMIGNGVSYNAVASNAADESGGGSTLSNNAGPLRSTMAKSAVAKASVAQAMNHVQSESLSAHAAAADAMETTGGMAPAQVNEVGITVPGSKVEQKFHTVYGFKAEEVSNVIILRLAGTVGNVEIKAPVIARANQHCSTCGKVNKAKANFCSGCGTSLQLL